MPFAIPWYVYVVLGFLALAAWKRSGGGATGGTGKVVGIVGRMGSGKSYFAVRMAYKRMMAGANVRTNFTMKLDPLHDTPCGPKCIKRGRCKCVKHPSGTRYFMNSSTPRKAFGAG